MQKGLLLFTLAVACVFSPAQADNIYKWFDARGFVHYTMTAPATADAEVISLPGMTTATVNLKNTLQPHFRYHQKHAARFILISDRDDERAAQEYNRKYGAVARLKRLEAEKRKQKALAEQRKRQEAWQNARQQRQKQIRERISAQHARLVARCEADHETDCENPTFLKKWYQKKYGRR